MKNKLVSQDICVEEVSSDISQIMGYFGEYVNFARVHIKDWILYLNYLSFWAEKL